MVPLNSACPFFPDKRQYQEKWRAKAVIKRWHVTNRSRFEVYRCDGCNQFHIGTKLSIIAASRKG